MSRDIVVQDREELLYLLCEAAEFEHTVMCTYLYAMWSLKREPDETCTAADLEVIERWRGDLRQVALEEMLHLGLVNNILAALGASPQLTRPTFPVPAGRFPADVVFSLRRFCVASVAHFAFIERPEGIEMEDGAGFDHPAHYTRLARADLLTPMPQDYGSQGHLYHGIARALHDLVERYGEDEVFVGHGASQISAAEFRLHGLFEVTDLSSALRAIEEIVVQGEGAPAHSETSHYATFKRIGEELAVMTAARPEFEPAHRSATDPALSARIGDPNAAVINAPLAISAVDIGDALYALMMRTLSQVFSPSPLPLGLRQGLAGASGELMVVAGVVAEVAARLPSGINSGPHAGSTGGLTLALPPSNGQLVQSCAAQILAERADEIAHRARTLASTAPFGDVADRLTGLAVRLRRLHERFEEHISLHVDELSGGAPEEESAAEIQNRAAEDEADPNVAVTSEMTLRFDGKRCIHSRRCVMTQPGVYLANVSGPWLHPEVTSVEAVVRTAHACPSGAITYERHDGGADETAPPVNVLRTRENGPYGVRADMALEGHGRQLRATLCRCGESKNKPFCDNSHRADGFIATGEPVTIESAPLKERGGELSIDPLTNGPLQVNGNLEICAGTGRTVQRLQSCRLCRCGGSSTKPFCDNTHLRNGFRSDS
ncbi:MAG: CDGSH-type Zn-finger protein/uncharacterized Fe-S cluster protein YjdI [Myxococcota bacterium]|jgi:CDGSH-type Zn-finger protein/uncharacterized Fe-S cluster protein YjdI